MGLEPERLPRPFTLQTDCSLTRFQSWEESLLLFTGRLGCGMLWTGTAIVTLTLVVIVTVFSGFWDAFTHAPVLVRYALHTGTYLILIVTRESAACCSLRSPLGKLRHGAVTRPSEVTQPLSDRPGIQKPAVWHHSALCTTPCPSRWKQVSDHFYTWALEGSRQWLPYAVSSFPCLPCVCCRQMWAAFAQGRDAARQPGCALISGGVP